MLEQTKVNEWDHVHLWQGLSPTVPRQVECGEVVATLSKQEARNYLMGKVDELFNPKTDFFANMAAKGTTQRTCFA